MPSVYVGIGSNLRPEENLQLCAKELRQRFTLRAMSPVYRNQAVGFEGADFLNLVACVETSMSPQAMFVELEEIHALAGRRRSGKAYASRTLDIDLLLYDDLVIEQPPIRLPRNDVLAYSFVLGPLAEIAPDLIHPLTGKRIADHWAEFNRGSHQLVLEPLTL